MLNQLLKQPSFSRDNMISLLSVKGDDTQKVLNRALEVKAATVGRNVYLRGLIELSNVCAKDCYYCGIRKANSRVHRYTLTDEEVFQAADFAWRKGFGSLVIQSGELSSPGFASHIERLLKGIHQRTNAELSVTLSCGEQPYEVFKRWHEAGAHRYLLRIETTNRALYDQIHPQNPLHAYAKRIEALEDLRKAGYQVGTGVMIGLPGQTIADLADDLIFFKSLDVDMVGMGPYIEHAETPLFEKFMLLWPAAERFRMSLLMIAGLRLLMPDINMASSTALETLDPLGRQSGLLAGANVVMPNLTPVINRINYQLYNNKPNLDKDPALSTSSLNEVIEAIGEKICYFEPGTSRHFLKRQG
ncbi:MAG: [FeFe] hydrogenase H-cluster radical SAM maturase HydE [Bacteroidetes bacterium]|nr:[FeFe] hydrogenase H-cluster radical SAM maturase HydE [Bacteroidota bacterium]MBU1580125.1 [FeFe] hydrogenase H-cluster radical SAM maturase HydE [Bacteroidota bacterium]MBU2465863.1 [FeFe] hydrogenase H-cluster radical SAM maturase HydE [Bacteroidota bacterium]MBU2556247.1 [FeFe] hydrogenase H-cluster radical SAM maturase HydE [Bacteroidota bacterium]